jgi:hypothetical protein
MEKAFTEWDNRWKENPEWFDSDEIHKKQKSETYGGRAAVYFAEIIKDVRKKK